jgi:predicted LPLAT superfamily acyltransferase
MPYDNAQNKAWDGKSRGGSVGHQIFIFLLKSMGLRAAYFLLAFVAFWFALFARKGAKAQYYLFRKCLKYPFLKSVWFVYKNHFRFGQILLDKIAIFSGMAHKFSFEHHNTDVIRSMIQDKTGGILLNAHIGSWEAAGELLRKYGGTIHIVMVQNEHEQIRQHLENMQSERQIKIIPINENGEHLFAIREVLMNKGVIAMHGDRFMEGNAVIDHLFLGEQAKFPAGPFHLAARYGVPLSFATAFRQNGRRYVFYAMKPFYVKQKANIKERKAEIAKQSELYVQALESKLKEYPLQWFNYYNFWKQ